MSLKISVRNPETEECMELNWLRNPFGLCTWAEDNYASATKITVPETETLWYAINNWSYERSSVFDRPLFLNTVKRYGDVLLALETGYYWFDVAAYIHYIQPQYALFPVRKSFVGDAWIEGAILHAHKLGIPMHHFNHACFDLGEGTLAGYKTWYRELIGFAELLQVPSTIFYCMN